MKEINTQGVLYLDRVEGSAEWYWGSDYSCGDLYEAEDAFKEGHAFTPNRLVFVHYPDGRTICPVTAREGQYLGSYPVFADGKLVMLLADFPSGTVHVLAYDDPSGQLEMLAEISVSELGDCHNLNFYKEPLMLIKQTNDNQFRIIFPFRAEFTVSPGEGFSFRDGNRLYFSTWHEDENGRNYSEDVIVRSLSGELLERITDAAIQTMPDGQKWLLK